MGFLLNISLFFFSGGASEGCHVRWEMEQHSVKQEKQTYDSKSLVLQILNITALKNFHC